MVLVQPPSSSVHDGQRFLIASDLADPQAARRELEEWAHEKGYCLPADARRLSVFEHGVLVREWVLVETSSVPRQERKSVPAAIVDLFAGHKKRRSGPAASRVA